MPTGNSVCSTCASWKAKWLQCRGVLLQHPYSAAAMLYFISQAFPAVLRQHTEWTEVYVAASRDLLTGRDFLAGPGGYLYPPFFTVLSIPFTLLPVVWSQFIWYAFSFFCLVFFVKRAWFLSGGGSLQGAAGEKQAKEHLIFLAGCLCSARFLQNALSHTQTDLLIAALIIAGCFALLSGRNMLAATWIGFAAAFKCTPLLFAPYLAWKGKWIPAIWLVIFAVGLNFLPDLVHSSPSGGSWAALWFTRYLRPMTQSEYVPGSWHTAIVNNQSISGAVNRLFTTRVESTHEGVEITTRESILSLPALRYLTFLLYAVLLLVSWFAFRQREGDLLPDNPRREVLEYSTILLLMLLFSPNSSPAHFGVMLLPAFCIARVAVKEKNHALQVGLIAATFFTLVSNNFPGLKPLHILTHWAGAVSIAAFILWVGCICALLRNGPQESISYGCAEDSPGA